jgi:hypothetical protein
VVSTDGTSFFARFSGGVKKGLTAGDITPLQIGNLVVYATTYADQDGVEQHRLVLGVPQGQFNSKVDAAEIKAAAEKNPFTSKKVSLAEMNLAAMTF